LPVLFLNSSK